MGIFGALTTAVTGMRAQSFALENISGNIANSQTTAFKRIDSTFIDLIPDNDPNKQFAGSVVANSRSTNAVQGDIQNSSVGTFMAINGEGFFVVQKPSNFADNRPVFDGIDHYTRRGDFQTDKNGYLVNGAGYYLMGIPVDATTGNLTGSVPQLLQFANDFLPAQPTTQVQYRANLASYPLTAGHDNDIPGSELLNPANFSANPIAGPPAPAKILGSGATLDPDAAAVLNGTVDISGLSSAGGSLVINGTAVAIAAADNAAAIVTKINLLTGTHGVTASLNPSNQLRSDQRQRRYRCGDRRRQHAGVAQRARNFGRHHLRQQPAHPERGVGRPDLDLHDRRQPDADGHLRIRRRPGFHHGRPCDAARHDHGRHRHGEHQQRQHHRDRRRR